MALKFLGAAFNFNGGAISIAGDGISVSGVLDLEKAPAFGQTGTPLDFRGNYPDSIFIGGTVIAYDANGVQDTTFTVTLSVQKSKILFQLNKPLANFVFSTNSAGFMTLPVALTYNAN